MSNQKARLVVLAALLGLGAIPTIAIGALRLHRIASAASPAIGGGATGGYAYLADATHVVARTPGGKRAVFGVTSGCRPTALDSGAVALTCIFSEPPFTAVEALTFVDGATRILTPPPGRNWDEATRIGSKWLIATTSQPDGESKSHFSRWAINLRNGQTIDLGQADTFGSADPFGPRKWLNPDRDGLGQPLCQPVSRRQADRDDDSTAFYPVDVAGKWVLQRFEDSYSNAFLQRCGTTKVQQFGPGTALGKQALAYLTGNVIHLRNLGRSRTVAAKRPAGSDDPPILAFDGARLVVSVFKSQMPSAPPAWNIYTSG
jgi:hypothetical protein